MPPVLVAVEMMAKGMLAIAALLIAIGDETWKARLVLFGRPRHWQMVVAPGFEAVMFGARKLAFY